MFSKVRTLMAVIAATTTAFAKDKTPKTFGLIESDWTSSGYTLFAPYRGTAAYLIDDVGRLINLWEEPDGYSAGASMYLTEWGTLVRGILAGGIASGGSFDWGAGAGIGGLIREYDWYGHVLWEYEYHTDEHISHHDIAIIPNGNVLITAYEKVPGLNPEWNWDHLIEVKPDRITGKGGTIVWEWHLKDHLGANDPKKWDATKQANFNSIDYHPVLDQIVIGCNMCNELFIIDHSISTMEAKGTKGDFLYRWGNPANYGANSNHWLGFQHTVRWIKDRANNDFGLNLGSDKNQGQTKKADINNVGNIIAYNNRFPSMASSSVIEIRPPLQEDGTYSGLGPDAPEVLLTELTDSTGTHPFASFILSSAQKLPNGRYLIGVGVEGEIYEVEPDGKVVWKYRSPVYSFNPGGSPSSDWDGGKCPDGIVSAYDASLPPAPANTPGLTDPTTWFFRATRYVRQFNGFIEMKLLRPTGPILTDLAGTTQPVCGNYIGS